MRGRFLRIEKSTRETLANRSRIDICRQCCCLVRVACTRETELMLASADAMVKVEREGELLMLPVGSMLCVKDVIVTEEAGIVVSYPGRKLAWSLHLRRDLRC